MRSKKAQSNSFMQSFLRFAVLFSIAFGSLATGFLWLVTQPLLQTNETVAFSIPPGESLRVISQRIEKSGIRLPAWQLELLGRLTGRTANIKAGSYEISGEITAWQLLNRLTRGEVSQAQITLIEGHSFSAFRAALNAHPDLRHDTATLTDAEIIAKLAQLPHQPTEEALAINPLTLISLEGLVFPDTYLFDKGSSDFHLLTRAYLAMQRQTALIWAQRQADLPLQSPYELLILASIIEKETGQANDRPLIASVFINRLRLKMPLQTDPSVIYGLGTKFDGNLRRSDLQTDTPWNTYTRRGLPPTPISSPGFAALSAAAKPSVSDKFYFVAKGNGTSVFSHSLEEHNRAVAQYQKGNR